MATYSKSANGASSRKVGRVIGSNWRIDESRKPRLDMMYIGLIVALGLAC